jgi:hypothetical protein
LLILFLFFHIAGRLQSWSLIAHGTETDPNAATTTAKPEGVKVPKKESPILLKKEPADNQFDGENSLVPLNAEMAADSLSVSSSSASSVPSSSTCAKLSNQGQCLGLCLFLLFLFAYVYREEEGFGRTSSVLPQESKPPPRPSCRNRTRRSNVNSNVICSTFRIRNEQAGVLSLRSVATN